MEKKRFSPGNAAGLVFLILVASVLINPSLLFFTSPEQQEQIALFANEYIFKFFHDTGKVGLPQIAIVAIIAMAAYYINLFVSIIGDKIKMKNRHAETIKALMVNLVKYAVVICALIISLSALGVNMVAVFTSLGIMGLVVGFGAQTLIEDVITGFFIIFEGQIHVGDIITIDNFRGTVTAIGIRTTCLTDAGMNMKIVNNSDIRTITNLSEQDSYATAEVSIAYGADLIKAEEVVKETLAKMPELYPNVFVKEPVYSGVQTLNTSSVDLRVAAMVAEANIYSARRLLNRELKLAMDAAGIEIPFPQVVVHQPRS